MINPAFNYAFVDINETEQVIHGNEVNNRGGWTGVTTYFRYDAVTFDGDDFIALAANASVTPGSNPTLWSYLVQIDGDGTPVINAGSDYTARMLGSLAYNTALEAYELAQTGTNLIYVEQGTRSEADQYLQNLIVAETGSRIAGQDAIIAFVFGSIAVDLTAETGSRIAADIAEAGTRSEADQYLQNLIVAESGSRVAGEQALIAFVFGSIAVDLTNETGSRIAADNYESGTRSEADQYLQNQVTVEIQERTSADQTIIRIASTGTSVAYEAYALAATGTIPPPLSTLPDVSIPSPSANQVLAFDGSRWIAADAATQVAPSAFTYFLEDLSSGTLTYERLLPNPSGLPEELDNITVGGTRTFAGPRAYLSEFLNRTRIDAGIWEFNVYGKTSVNGEAFVFIVELYTLSLNGVETFILSGTTPEVTSDDPQLVTEIVTAGSYNIATTDKLLAKFYVYRDNPVQITATLYHSGSTHDSHFHTPLATAHNDLGGLQGGSSSAYQFYHLTLDAHQATQGTSGYPSNTNRFVTNDSLIAEQGTRSEADQNLLNLISTVSGSTTGSLIDLTYALIAERGTRSEADQYLQNQVTSVGSLAQLAYDLASVSPAFPDVGNRLISGGNAIWVSGYTFSVQPTVVDFNGTSVSFPQTNVTLAASDPVDDRIDIIVADNAIGTIKAITGTPSTPPAFPDYDPIDQFQLTFIPVDAATTQPAEVTRTWIYQENVEWAFTASNPTINPNSGTTPYEGTKCIEGTTVLNNQYFYSQAPVAFALDSYDTVYFYLKPKSGWGTRYLRLNWETSSGSRKGNYVSVNNGAFGFSTSNLNYQLIAIPLSLFGVPSGTNIQRLRMTVISSSGSMGFYIDNIALQIGVTTPSYAIPDATTSTKGIVLLATNGGTSAATAVQGNDSRLALAVIEPGTRSSADQFLQNQVTGNLQILATEIVNRTNNDNYQQAEIDSLFGLLGVGFSGTFAWWMAQIRGGLTDTKLNVINGVVAGITESTFSWEDFEFYGTGSIGSEGFTKGTSWNGAGILVISPVPGVVAEETYISLPVGPVSTIPLSVTVGTGWSAAGTVGAETTVGFYGSDTFDAYSTGTVAAGAINAGFNWAGTATITAIP